jgi:hypothetical protein
MARPNLAVYAAATMRDNGYDRIPEIIIMC